MHRTTTNGVADQAKGMDEVGEHDMDQGRHSRTAGRSELPLGLRFVVVLVVGATLMLLLLAQLTPGSGSENPVQRIVPAQEASAPQLETWTERQGTLERECSRSAGCEAWRAA